jgi:hypothetical protein
VIAQSDPIKADRAPVETLENLNKALSNHQIKIRRSNSTVAAHGQAWKAYYKNIGVAAYVWRTERSTKKGEGCKEEGTEETHLGCKLAQRSK